MSSTIAVCTWGAAGGLPEETEEALTVASSLAAATGAEVRLAVLGDMADSLAETAGKYGVVAVDRITDPKLAEFSADTYVEALVQYAAAQSPRVIVFAQTFDVRSVAPRLAGRTGAAVMMNATEIEADGEGFRVTVAAYGGDTRQVYDCAAGGAYVFSVAPNAVESAPGDGAAAAVSDVSVDLSSVSERVRVVERAEAAEGPRLEHAQIVVAGGRGLGAAEQFALIEELAGALGGMAGASRPIVDDGWATPAQQVGLTGKITKPALYIAAGISGASQHMVGCTAAKTLVAVNKDPDAAIFRYAHFGIVGDCLEVLPELTRAVKG